MSAPIDLSRRLELRNPERKMIGLVQATAVAWDRYKRHIYATMPPDPPFTEEELADMRNNGLDLSELIEEIERDLAEGASQ